MSVIRCIGVYRLTDVYLCFVTRISMCNARQQLLLTRVGTYRRLMTVAIPVSDLTCIHWICGLEVLNPMCPNTLGVPTPKSNSNVNSIIKDRCDYCGDIDGGAVNSLPGGQLALCIVLVGLRYDQRLNIDDYHYLKKYL